MLSGLRPIAGASSGLRETWVGFYLIAILRPQEFNCERRKHRSFDDALPVLPGWGLSLPDDSSSMTERNAYSMAMVPARSVAGIFASAPSRTDAERGVRRMHGAGRDRNRRGPFSRFTSSRFAKDRIGSRERSFVRRRIQPPVRDETGAGMVDAAQEAHRNHSIEMEARGEISHRVADAATGCRPCLGRTWIFSDVFFRADQR